MTKAVEPYTDEELSIFIEGLDTPGGALDQPYEVGRLLATIEARDARIAELGAVLHSKEMHLGFEYETTKGPRKAFYEPEPEGDGWVANTHKGRDGWERFDYHEEAYWMRPTPPVKGDG